MRNSRAVDAPDTPTLESSATRFETSPCRCTRRRSARTSATWSPRLTRAWNGCPPRYRQLLQSLSPGRADARRAALGRRVVDIKRLASLLPKVPPRSTPRARPTASRAAARPASGESRACRGRTSSAQRRPRGRGVGGDIESWCGRCGEIAPRTASSRWSGSEPKQVLCQVCGSRHTYRTGPARQRRRPATPRQPRATTVRAARRSRGRSEGGRAARPGRRGGGGRRRSRVFDPKERYKAGEIIVHPEYGRGKIENVLRSSLLVRFPIGGLKSLMLDVAVTPRGCGRRPYCGVDLVEEALQQPVDHQVAAGGVVAAGAVTALGLLEAGAGLGDQRPEGADLAGDLLLVLDQVADQPRRPARRSG